MQETKEAGVGVALLECWLRSLPSGPVQKIEGTGHPIFEIIQDHQHIKIYANGVVEGLGTRIFTMNHIPEALGMGLFAFDYFSKPWTFSKSPQQVNPDSFALGGEGQSSPPNDSRMSKQSNAATGEKYKAV